VLEGLCVLLGWSGLAAEWSSWRLIAHSNRPSTRSLLLSSACCL
jgi:hypothetical protein